ncbi:hypothetical protein KC336_g20707, partial [Hortaea werneckii]
DKLAHLLNTIGTDARNATSISISSPASSATSSDYHELLTVTTQLLSDAQSLSTWTFDMIESNEPQVEPFAEKVALVERVAGELRERVLQQQQQQQQMQMQQMQTTNTIATPNTAGSRSCVPSLSAASSKKRSRSCEDDDGEGEEQQRQQQYQQSNTLSHKRSRIFAAPAIRDQHYHLQQQQQQQQQQDIMSGIEPTTTMTTSCGTHADRFLQTPWWTQRPICD